MKTEYSEGLGAECLTRSARGERLTSVRAQPEHVVTAASAVLPGEAGSSERVVGRLDSLNPHVNLALGAVVRRVNKHVHDHGPPVRVGAPLPRRNVPGSLDLFLLPR